MLQPTTGKARSASPLVHFSYLQVLDLLTTLAFLSHGVGEANPIVRFAVACAPSAAAGLLAVKSAAMLFGLYCWQSGRRRLLGRANVFFAALIVWNLVALIGAPAA